METIPHRELRNHSSEILARVSRGESIAVTNHGELAAIMSPPSLNALDRARQAGEVRERRRTDVRFDAVPRASLAATTRDILDDVRGDR
jgi:prevent-host-death family protein